MPSTDIDGTPILMFAAPEIEYLVELMEGIAKTVPKGELIFGWQNPIETSMYKMMQRFLDEPNVMGWLDNYNEELADAIYEDLKEEGLADGN